MTDLPTLVQIEIAYYITTFNIDKELLTLEKDGDIDSVNSLIKEFRTLRSKLPSKSSASYYMTEESYITYKNDNDFTKEDSKGEEETIKKGAVLSSVYIHVNGFQGLLIAAHDATDKIISELENIETQDKISQNEIQKKEKEFLKLLYDTIASNFIIENSFEEFYDTSLDKKIEIRHSDKSKLFPKELKNYQVGYLLKRIVSYYKPIEFRLRYNLADAEGITPNNYHNAKRTLDKYFSKYKNKEKPKNFVQFKININELFSKVDNFKQE